MIYKDKIIEYIANHNKKSAAISCMDENMEPVSATGVDEELPDLLLPLQQKTLAEQRVKTVKARYLPTLSLTGYAGGLGYQEKFRLLLVTAGMVLLLPYHKKETT